jgi:hypothetical protein
MANESGKTTAPQLFFRLYACPERGKRNPIRMSKQDLLKAALHNFKRLAVRAFDLGGVLFVRAHHDFIQHAVFLRLVVMFALLDRTAYALVYSIHKSYLRFYVWR